MWDAPHLSVSSDVIHGDHIYRNSVKYELIRQEGKSEQEMTEGQTVVTYLLRKKSKDGSNTIKR